ncbi:MAG: glycerol-3-phosphate dehydrogenase/oxidase [Bacteroidales bacterium]
MNRDLMIKQLEANKNTWDIVVVGGGATGLGAALESATRGYNTLLLEQDDFSKGTSSRSTKLVHGGVRYLAQGDVSLVLEALHERGLLMNNAPHLVRNQAFIIPTYAWWGGPFYTVGLKVYDMMAGKLGLGPSVHISKEKVLKSIPTLRTDGLKGGVIYHDGQFDDSRLAINLAQTFVENGGTILNYAKVTSLTKDSTGLINGLTFTDVESDKEYTINAKAVVNATGVWVDDIMHMDNPKEKANVKPSQGVHLILEKEFLQGDHAIMIPKTDDGRVLFAVPWHNKVVVGTTDTLVDHASLEPRALKQEVKFILDTAGRYLTRKPTAKDVKSIFAGLRPLAAPSGDSKKTKEISRSHKLIVSISGLVTITGGKWTTYRKMGEDTIDKAAMIAGLVDQKSVTKRMAIHGYLRNFDPQDPLYYYGSDISRIKQLIQEDSSLGELIHPSMDYIKAQIVWAARFEMARNVEDVLARRVRALFLDARASVEMAPEVARILAQELHKDETWQKDQIAAYTELAKGYILE